MMTEVLKMYKFQGKCLLLLMFPAFVSLEDSGWETKKYSDQIEKMIKNDRGLEVEENDDTPMVKHEATYRRQIPEYFDARKQWGYCQDIIGYIRNQGDCATCWANGAAGVISDRICIGSKGATKKLISVEDQVACCSKDGRTICKKRENRCYGGAANSAFSMWLNVGIVSGGNHNETDPQKRGCLPYGERTFEGEPPECRKRCTSPGYEYKKDKHYGKVKYRVYAQARAMQIEIMNHGPIATLMYIYDDYRRYGSGVYQYTWGEYDAKHIVKIIGWGTERGRPYWLIANSYGEEWGEYGFFRVRRGRNEVEIESFCITGRTTPLSRVREWIVVDRSSSFRNLQNETLLKCLYLYLFFLCLN